MSVAYSGVGGDASMTSTCAYRPTTNAQPIGYICFVRAVRGDEGQSLLGVDGFAEGLRRLLSPKQQIREVPKGQRFAGRPTLENYSRGEFPIKRHGTN